MSTIRDRTILITGAGSGIGRILAELLAAEGGRLALLDINAAALDEVAAELGSAFATVRTYPCDVADRHAAQRTADRVRADFAQVDILVNNAGVVTGKFFYEASCEDIERTVGVNLLGVIWMTRQFIVDMMKRNSGHIVNIASAAGLLALPRLADYCATKFAVVGLSDALRLEMRKCGCRGVRVSCICPSVIDTGMFAGFRPPRLNPLLQPADVAAKIVKTIRTDRPYLKMPFMVKMIPLLRMLPTAWLDTLGALTGTTRAMDHFRANRRPGSEAP
jgi:all-trans-retinol dehydrogenase (NAD+)